MLDDLEQGLRAGEEFPDFEALLGAMPAALNTYSSPLLRRVNKSGLTLALLAEHVPPFQAGQAAEERLKASDKPAPTPQQREALQRDVAAGERAKEVLVTAAIPLLRLLANKEFERRGGSQGKSRTTREELFQEGIFGLFSGLRKYNPSGSQSSPTNYLGSWITVRMQRATDGNEHDFTVPNGVAQRYRRIHAIRARLQAELGRAPTDDEIIEAWTDTNYQPGRMMGRLDQGETKNVVTYKQLEDERQYASRMGVKAMPVDEEGNTRAFDEAVPLETAEEDQFADEHGDDDAKRFVSELFAKTLGLLNVGQTQRLVISLKYGLDGYDEHPVAAIIGATRLSRPKVTAIIDAFTTEMTRKNGAFHKVCSQVDQEDLLAGGMGWVLSALGSYSYAQIVPPEVLTVQMAPPSDKPPPPPLRANERPGQVRAQFMCPVHRDGFIGNYRDTGEVPSHRPCPRCDRDAAVIRVLET